MTRNKLNSLAAAAGTVLLHGFAAARLLAWDAPAPAPPAAARTVLQVRVVTEAAAQPTGARSPERGAPSPAATAHPGAVYFHLPEEVDRPLIVLRDRSGDADITLEGPVVMHLFVDAEGRVARVEFEGEPPSAALQAQLRLAFAPTEFLPALKGGRAVAARIKIELLQQPEGE